MDIYKNWIFFTLNTVLAVPYSIQKNIKQPIFPLLLYTKTPSFTMRAHFVLAAVLSSCFTPAAAQSLPSLQDALAAAGASNFAALIDANPNASELYSSGTIKTVFAPADWATGNSTLARRDAAAEAALAYQGCLSTYRLGMASLKPGVVMATALKNSKLKDKQQKAVADTRPANATKGVSKRQILDSRAPHRRSTNSTSLLRIDAGLGAVSNVVQGDIAFDGGLIHVTDRYELLIGEQEARKSKDISRRS